MKKCTAQTFLRVSDDGVHQTKAACLVRLAQSNPKLAIHHYRVRTGLETSSSAIPAPARAPRTTMPLAAATNSYYRMEGHVR
ncbi:hypothetical protein PILCRDRAFT_638546 [Piloderma croceum F 1598]|uniref:Uncharacterized protein n=1 Tax=Piloderma croceum (strain F 1598) TaxID=765440 RepID=A0A0C3FA97_PILCF|nr:hypothetical protein PILCRDRAFT_638546 [Piloderma croceum F 1598]